MKTVAIDKVFDDIQKSERSYSHDLFWIILWILISFSSRIWGDLLYKILDKVFGKGRTVEQLLALTLFSFLTIFVFVRMYDFDVDIFA